MKRIIKFALHSKEGPKKTVTIRDVNQSLYNQFASLSARFGGNLGTLFSHIIDSYGKQYHPFMVRPGPKLLHHFEDKSIEVIENLEELQVSKDDLTEAGDNTRFIFKNIDTLIFDETVDNPVLMKHVLRIRKSQVVTKGAISKLFLKSIDQGQFLEQHFQKLDPKTTNITIRNVDEQTYEDFVARCHSNQVKVGEAVNEIFKRSIPHFEIGQIITHDPKLVDIDLIVLTMHHKLLIENKDLVDLEGRKILLHRISQLVFEDDIAPDLFKQSVMGIYNCEDVSIPQNIPKLLQLSRVKQYPS